MITDLNQLVSIPSVSQPAEGEYPFGKPCHDALETALALCQRYGLRTKKCGNLCGYAEIGSGAEIFGILVHLDVVPAGSGWDFPPFAVTAKDGKLFGRGVIDDKGPAVAIIHAMKELANTPLNKRVRLLFGTSEETGAGTDIAYYKETEEEVSFGFTPDADFPVVYLEKGLAEIKLSFRDEMVNTLCAGVASNMVADQCTLTFTHQGQTHTVQTTGKSAHGSMPWLGENAIGLAMGQAMTLAESQGFTLPIASAYQTLIGMAYDGAGLGCDFCDQQSGPTTVNVGLAEKVDDQLVFTLDIRLAVTATKEALLQAVCERVVPLGFTVELTDWVDPVHQDPSSEFIQTLMQAYRGVTGDDTPPLTMGGATYAREMKNIVAFGPTFPGRECTEHQPNEYVYEQDFYQWKQIYQTAITLIAGDSH